MLSVRRGFTLLELLVVVVIITLLTSMVMPLVGIARKRAAVTNTESLMRKVETGLELFKGELDAYPYQAHDEAESFPENANRLARWLATDLTLEERTDLDADLSIVREAYMEGGAHYVDLLDVDPKVSSGKKDGGNQHFLQHSHAAHVNRAATERAALAVIIGYTDITGILDMKAVKILSNPVSDGFAVDFLSFDLNKSDIQGESLVDA